MWVFNGQTWANMGILPSGNLLQFALGDYPVEIVDLPMEIAWWICPSFFGTVYQRVTYPPVIKHGNGRFFPLNHLCLWAIYTMAMLVITSGYTNHIINH